MKYRTTGKVALFTLLLATGSTVHSFAQKTRKLSLGEAVRMSIDNSGRLKTSLAKVDEAVANSKEAWNNHLPDVKVTGAYMRLNTPTVKLKTSMGGGGSDTSGGSSGGGGVKVDQAMYGIVNASLPLFSGFRIKYGVESARYLEKAAKLDVSTAREDVMLNTVEAFANLYKATRTVEIVKENLKQQTQRVADFTNLEKNGLLARNDLLKAQLQQSNIELTVLEAENNLKIAWVNMNLMIGLPEDTELTPDTAGFQIKADIGSVAQWEQTALQNRKDINALTMREKAAAAGVKATKGEFYPGIALTGGYIAADVPNVLTITNALNIGLGLQYNLGALWKTGAKVAAANARVQQIQYNQSMLNDEVRAEISKAYYNYILSLKKIDVYRKAVEQANENYRITKNKYDNSLANTTDLLDADAAQLQAKINYTLVQAAALVAYKELIHTAGTIENDFPTIAEVKK